MVDKELIGHTKVRKFSAYLMLPLDRYFSVREIADRTGMTLTATHRWLLKWTESNLFEKMEYNGTGLRTRYQYRRMFNRITITRLGILFELVKEEMI